MKLSVVIISYKVKYYLEQCLLSLAKALEGIEAEVFVVDNHSDDGSVEYLSRRFKKVKFISSRHNLGFARGNNLAIRRCTGEYILLLNPDTILSETVLRDTIAFMDAHQDAGSCGVRMSHSDGTDAPESRRGLPSPLTAFYKMSGLCARFPHHPKFGRYYMGNLPWDSPQEIDVVSGAYCMLRRSVIDKVGSLDEDYFMYGEDIDLSYRILKGGFKNYYLPYRMLHYKGESTEKSSFRYVHVFYDSMIIFLRKHYSHFSLIVSLPINIAIYAKATVALLKMQMHAIRKSLGFFVGHRHKDPAYVFIGRHNDECRELAADNGLEAIFVDGDNHTTPQGHHAISLPAAESIVVVYDTEAYSYSNMLEIFASKPIKGVRIGTYNPNNNVLITPEDIFAK